MVSIGCNVHDKVITTLTFLNVKKMQVQLDGGQDEWWCRMVARARSQMINNGQSHMLPWEELAYDVGTLPGVPSATRVPDAWAVELNAGREAAFDYLGGKCYLLKDMQHKMLAKEKDILDIDRFMILELTWLHEHAETTIRERVHNAVFHALPSHDTTKQMKEVFLA